MRGSAPGCCHRVTLSPAWLIASARDLLRAIAKTGSRVLRAKQAISGDHRHSDDHAPHARHYCLSAETRPASPNAAPQAVFLLGPYFSGFLLVIKNIIGMKELITPENSGYGLAGTGFPNGKLPPESGLTPIAYIRFR